MVFSESKINVRQFINGILIDNIGAVVNTGNHYLGFGLAQGIELIGAIIEDDAAERQLNSHSEFETEGKSRRRFYNGLGVFSNPNYQAYCSQRRKDANVDYDLYNHLRCGYAHLLKPTGLVKVTTKPEAINDGNRHLEIDPRTGGLILVSEILFTDFQEACEKVIQMIDQSLISHTKPYTSFLSIYSFNSTP
jgi:hypothetical protein